MNKSLSLVTARVVRQNEQYGYKVVGKGERYLVLHEENENAGDKVVEFLKPYASEPVRIVQTTLQKKGLELIGDKSAESFYNATAEYMQLTESGKERKVVFRFIVQAKTAKDALLHIDEHLSKLMVDSDGITMISKTKIIDVIG
ncbi:MAG: DUF4494 family protein [Tannerella sp.]|uniref:DUF4494 family protein n=1 Tax=Tannerella sp. TaxID=2382127 RepID=UPI003FA2D759